MATATDKGIVKVIDRVKLTTVASYKEGNSSSSGGGGIYSVAMSPFSGGNGGQHTALGGTSQMGGTVGGGQPGAGTQSQTFAISSRSNIIILNFEPFLKWQKKINGLEVFSQFKYCL